MENNPAVHEPDGCDSHFIIGFPPVSERCGLAFRAIIAIFAHRDVISDYNLVDRLKILR